MNQILSIFNSEYKALIGLTILLLCFSCIALYLHRGKYAKISGSFNLSYFTRRDLIYVGLVVCYLLSIHIYQPQSTTKDPEESIKKITPYAIFVSQFIGMLFPVLLIKLHVGTLPSWTKRKVNGFIAFVIYPLLALIATVMIENIIRLSGINNHLQNLLHCKDQQDVVVYFALGSLSLKVTIAVCAIIIAPIIEEFLFRGYIYPVTKKYMGVTCSVIFTSVLFGIIHWNMSSFIPLSIFGAFMIFLYEKTGSLKSAMIAHGLLNATSILALLYQVNSL